MSGEAFDTIVAPATAEGKSALAIVRIDGPDAGEVISRLAGRSFPPRTPTLTNLRLGEEWIDQCVVTVFRAPASFTGNDLVEVSVHGSPYIVSRLIRAVLQEGARPAEGGEFTERAVLNGKIDLVQAEAIIDLIDSRTEMQARLSLHNLGGELSRAATAVRDDLLFLISRHEAALDFSDEGYEFVSRSEAAAVMERVGAELDRMLETWDRGRAIVEGLTAVILGRPNAGKSTLLNFLCGTDRAIVTEIPGTTRDLLRETVELGGLPVVLVDTAGLRDNAELVEEIGIARAREAAAGADLVLYLIDSVEGCTEADEAELMRHPDAIRIYTKSDCSEPPTGSLAISVPKRLGLANLLERLDREVRQRFGLLEGRATLVNERQRRAVEEARTSVASALRSLTADATEEIVLVDLYAASGSLAGLTGVISHDDIYGEIFSRFCIGK